MDLRAKEQEKLRIRREKFQELEDDRKRQFAANDAKMKAEADAERQLFL